MIRASPIAIRMTLTTNISTNDDEKVNSTYYRSLVGSPLYLTLTTSDIMYIVNKVCQNMQQPQVKHLREVKRILRYLEKTMNHGIIFFKNSFLNLYGFCDADWDCPITERSTLGYCIFFR